MATNSPNIFLSNKQLLAEIHNSKLSYCQFVDEKYQKFDVIVDSVDDITEENATAVIAQLQGQRRKPVIPHKTDPRDVVFRVMTYSHIPLCDDRKKRSRAALGEGRLRVNFPPFKHYILVEGEVVEVGRSHWANGVLNGEFRKDQGTINYRLARMFILLVEKYGSRSNWRNYCVDEATEALTKRGWVNGNEIREDDTILSYDWGAFTWSSIYSIFRNPDYDDKMFHLTVTGMDALVSPGHKFMTEKGFCTAELLKESDQVILGGTAVLAPETPIHSDVFLELVGRAVTQGTYEERAEYTRVSIHSSTIDSMLNMKNLLSKTTSSYGESRTEQGVRFNLPVDLSSKIVEAAPNQVPTMPFILSLTHEQRVLLIDVMIETSGWRTERKNSPSVGFRHKSKGISDVFTTLCTLVGYRTSTKKRETVSNGDTYTTTVFSNKTNRTQVKNIDFHGGKRAGRGAKDLHPNVPTVDYKGLIWCPETEFGSFVCRRNGYVYLTGNTYVDQMKSAALAQLSQVGLQFDESKGDNPFAFYTQCMKNSFTRILNDERKHQKIRDDLLIMHGASPSHTRQIENELAQRAIADGTAVAVVEKPKRGRKPKDPAATKSSTPSS